jgi:hypothetical protein
MMDLCSLPPEILALICKFSILEYLGPERRLHPCTNSRYQRKTFRRREIPCHPLLLCCKDFHRIASEVLYQTSTVVVGIDYHSQPLYFRCYPTPDVEKDVLSVLVARTTVLPYIRNVELMISCSMGYDLTFNFDQDKSVQSFKTVLETHLPRVTTLSLSVGAGFASDYSPQDSAVNSTYVEKCQLEKVVKNSPFGLEFTKLRIWLSWAHFMTMINTVAGSADATAEDMALREANLPIRFSFLSTLKQLQHLKCLDVFIPLPSPAPGQLFSFPVTRLHLFTSSTWEKIAAERLTKALLPAEFAHVGQVTMWRALSDNISSGNYVAF